MATETEIYKREEILVCDFNQAIKEAITVINNNAKTGSHVSHPTTFNYQIGEPLRTKIVDELKAKLKKP